jgi:hypothetical protein
MPHTSALRRLQVLQSQLDHLANGNYELTRAEPNDVAVLFLNATKAITLIGSMILDVQVKD